MRFKQAYEQREGGGRTWFKKPTAGALRPPVPRLLQTTAFIFLSPRRQMLLWVPTQRDLRATICSAAPPPTGALSSESALQAFKP